LAYAVGIPALGLNPYGRPPFSDTLSGLGTALTLYLVGAALLATASRSIRERRTGSPTAVFAVIGASTLVWSLWVGLRSGRLGAAVVLLAGIALLAPIALGFRGFRSNP
jgi:glucose dehydrogenase